jgi:hypothetical protein
MGYMEERCEDWFERESLTGEGGEESDGGSG